MQKHLLGALLLGTAVMVASCKPEQQGEPQMTANDSKEYLVNVGKEVLGTFNAADQKEAVEFAEGVYRRYEAYDWDQIGDDFYEEFVNGRYKTIFSMPRSVAQIAAGHRMPSAEDAKYLFSLAGEGTTFTFDDATKTIKIERNNDGNVIVNFKDEKGTDCQLKIWGEGAETEYSYTYERYDWVCDDYNEEYDYCENGHDEYIGSTTITAKVPTTLKMTLKQGNKEIIGFDMSLETKKNDHFYFSYNIRVVNMAVTFDTKVNSTNANMAFKFIYNDTPVLAASANLPKYELIGKDDNMDWCEWVELYAERYEYLLGKIGAGEAKLDVLGKIQVKATVSDFASLYTDYAAWDKKYYSYNYEDYERTYTYNDGYGTETGYYCAWWEMPIYTLAAQEAFCNLYNVYCNAAVYYGNDVEQAKLKLQPYQETDVYTPYMHDPIPYSCYDTEYVFYFPKDDTSYSFEDYFTSDKFTSLVGMVEDLINSYIDLIDKDFDVGHIHF